MTFGRFSAGERQDRHGLPARSQVEGGDEGAEEADLVGGLVGAGAAQPGRAVGGDRDERVRRRGRPRAPPGAGWRPPCPTCRSPPPATRPWSARGRGTRPSARRSGCAAGPAPAAAASYAANASGALREPGASTTSRTPASTSAGDHGAGEVGRGGHGRPILPHGAHGGQPLPPTRRPGRARPRAASSAASSTAGTAHRQHPVDRQQRVDGHVVGEQLHGRQPAGVVSSGRAAARATPGRDARPRSPARTRRRPAARCPRRSAGRPARRRAAAP